MMKIFTLFFIFLNSFQLQAAELYQFGLPTRCLAMGGTCMSHVHGAQALFLNPAALARVEGFDFIIGQVQAGVSKDAQSVAEQMTGTQSQSSFSLNDVQSLYGKNVEAEVTARSGFVMPYFGVGAYSYNYLLESFGNPTYPTFNINYLSDYGYIIGGAVSMGPMTSLGVAVRGAKRWGGQEDVNVLSLVGANNKNLIDQTFPNHGTGTALDLSFLTTLQTDLKPTFTLVWQDVGTTRYQMYSGQQDPPRQSDNLIFGTSIEHDFLLGHWTHAFEYKFMRTTGEDLTKKLHLGTEVSYGLIDLQAGLNQGYLTYGAGVDLWFLELQAAVYATELGTYGGQTRSDRYQVSLTFSLDFDQSFKLTDLDGHKRKLKYRR